MARCVVKECPCGREFKTNRPERARYCGKPCFYKYRTRPSGLEYEIKKVNPTWIKPGSEPWNKGTKGLLKANAGSIKPGQRISPATEFKYRNGNGYRNLLIRGDLPQYCEECGDNEKLSRLHVHHIDHNRKNNRLDNLMVMCRPCHLAHHGKQERQYVEGRKVVAT